MLQVGFTILAQHWDNIEMLPGDSDTPIYPAILATLSNRLIYKNESRKVKVIFFSVTLLDVYI